MQQQQSRAPLVQHQQNTKQSPRLHQGTPRNVIARSFKRTKASRPDTKARTTTRHQVPFTRTARSKTASPTRFIRDALQETGSPHRIPSPHRHQTSAPRHQAARRLETATQGYAAKSLQPSYKAAGISPRRSHTLAEFQSSPMHSGPTSVYCRQDCPAVLR